MILYLFRHAEALSVGRSIVRDADRPLSPQGEHDAALMGQALARLDPAVSQVFTSPLRRALQTAELVAHAFSPPVPIAPMDALLPGIRYKSLYEELVSASTAANVVAIGHQPDLSQFISYLIADAAANIAIAPGTLVRLTVQANASQPDATLDWILTPALVRAFTSPL